VGCAFGQSVGLGFPVHQGFLFGRRVWSGCCWLCGPPLFCLLSEDVHQVLGTVGTRQYSLYCWSLGWREYIH